MPTKTPRDQELTWEQHVAHRALHCRQLRIEHAHSSIKRCRRVLVSTIMLRPPTVQDFAFSPGKPSCFDTVEYDRRQEGSRKGAVKVV
jgi:hypothetical protein